MKALIALVAAALVACPVAAQVPTGTVGVLRPDQKQFFELYKELVETDTTVANGNCTQAKSISGNNVSAYRNRVERVRDDAG